MIKLIPNEVVDERLDTAKLEKLTHIKIISVTCASFGVPIALFLLDKRLRFCLLTEDRAGGRFSLVKV